MICRNNIFYKLKTLVLASMLFLEVSHGKTHSRQAQDTATPQPAAATVCELCYPQGYSASANTGHIFLQNVGDLAWELKPTFVSLLCWKGHIKSL